MSVLVCLFISACNDAKPGTTEKAEKFDTVVVNKNRFAVFNSKINLDSIETVNNASVKASGNNITKVAVSKQDSSISIAANIRLDHRIFGYKDPDIKSERLLLLSVFTTDVKNNPFGCKLGSYYDTRGMENMKLTYLKTLDDFIEVAAIDSSNRMTKFYFEKKWVEFE